MTEPTGDAAPEWLTIGEAAARLGVSARSLRRAIERCQNEARNGAGTVPETVSVTRQTKTGPRIAAAFALPFLERLASDLGASDDAGGQNAALTGTVPKAGQKQGDNYSESEAGTVPVTVPPLAPVDGELVAQLRSEVAFLRSALEQAQAGANAAIERLDKEQENTRAALAQLADARREGQTFLAAVASGRLQLSAQEPETRPEAKPAQTSAPEAQSGPDTSAGGESAAPSKSDGKEETARPWWQFWSRNNAGK